MTDDAYWGEKTVADLVHEHLYARRDDVLARISPDALAEYLKTLVIGTQSPLGSVSVIELLPYCIAWQRDCLPRQARMEEASKDPRTRR